MRNKTTLAAGGLLFCAAVAWSGPVPTGVLGELERYCTWGRAVSEAACTALIERLEGVERPSRDERLALIWSRKLLSGLDSILHRGDEVCVETEALAAEHPDDADALYYLSFCTGHDESVALLQRAAEKEPDNYRVL